MRKGRSGPADIALDTRITALEGEVAAVKKVVGNDANSGLQKTVGDLQKTVGDQGTDINAVIEVVGKDANSGLQKTVGDQGTDINTLDENHRDLEKTFAELNLLAHENALTLKKLKDASSSSSADANTEDTIKEDSKTSTLPDCLAYGDKDDQSTQPPLYNPIFGLPDNSPSCKVPASKFALVNQSEYDAKNIETSFFKIISECKVGSKLEHFSNDYTVIKSDLIGNIHVCFVVDAEQV